MGFPTYAVLLALAVFCFVLPDNTEGLRIWRRFPWRRRKCGPVCLRYCRCGNVLNSKGCKTCACKPCPLPKPKCGFVCARYCPCGNVKNSKGCPICRCRKCDYIKPCQTCCGAPPCCSYCGLGKPSTSK